MCCNREKYHIKKRAAIVHKNWLQIVVKSSWKSTLQMHEASVNGRGVTRIVKDKGHIGALMQDEEAVRWKVGVVKHRLERYMIYLCLVMWIVIAAVLGTHCLLAGLLSVHLRGVEMSQGARDKSSTNIHTYVHKRVHTWTFQTPPSKLKSLHVHNNHKLSCNSQTPLNPTTSFPFSSFWPSVINLHPFPPPDPPYLTSNMLPGTLRVVHRLDVCKRRSVQRLQDWVWGRKLPPSPEPRWSGI